jgi:hypothetical protein
VEKMIAGSGRLSLSEIAPLPGWEEGRFRLEFYFPAPDPKAEKVFADHGDSMPRSSPKWRS